MEVSRPRDLNAVFVCFWHFPRGHPRLALIGDFWLVSTKTFLVLNSTQRNEKTRAIPPMKREARMLLEKASDSLLLCIEKFNCPFERGRVTSILIFLDHAFEMLLKAAILHRGGVIRKRGESETLGFDACVRAGRQS